MSFHFPQVPATPPIARLNLARPRPLAKRFLKEERTAVHLWFGVPPLAILKKFEIHRDERCMFKPLEERSGSKSLRHRWRVKLRSERHVYRCASQIFLTC